MIITTINGNVGRVEFKEVGETSLLEFAVASTEKSAGNEYTTWLTCKLWGKRADGLRNHIEVGTALVLSGSLREEKWEKDGENRSKHVLNVDKLDFQRGGSKQSEAKSEDEFGESIPF